MEDEIREKIITFGNRAVSDWTKEESGSLTPERTSNYHSILAGYAAVLEEEFASLEMLKPVFKTALEASASEAQRERVWESSESGQRHIQLKHKLNAIDRIISACKLRMRRFENEAFNRF